MPSRSRQRSLVEYSKRMNAVLDYIALHLAEPLELEQLSQIAHFSPFHFHRLFAACVGETLGEYVRRQRLEKGALQLAAQSQPAVLDVALAVGFGSGEAFSRAFKSHFACSPRDWQSGHDARWLDYLVHRRLLCKPAQVSNPDQVGPQKIIDHVTSLFNDKEQTMDVTIKTLPPMRIAYLRKVGPYGPQIAEFWQQSFIPWVIKNKLQQQRIVGISHDDPSITPPEKCRTDTGVEVGEDYVVTEPARVTSLPGGSYAVTHFKGTPLEIGEVWMQLFRVWLPGSGMQYDTRPCFELYPSLANDESKDGVFECDICISVKPL